MIYLIELTLKLSNDTKTVIFDIINLSLSLKMENILIKWKRIFHSEMVEIFERQIA